MVDDIRDSFTTECVIQRNKHSWIAITALLSHHPLEEKMVMVVMCCGYHRLTSTQLMEYTPRNVFCPVRILMWLRPLPKLRALSSTCSTIIYGLEKNTLIHFSIGHPLITRLWIRSPSKTWTIICSKITVTTSICKCTLHHVLDTRFPRWKHS